MAGVRGRAAARVSGAAQDSGAHAGECVQGEGALWGPSLTLHLPHPQGSCPGPRHLPLAAQATPQPLPASGPLSSFLNLKSDPEPFGLPVHLAVDPSACFLTGQVEGPGSGPLTCAEHPLPAQPAPLLWDPFPDPQSLPTHVLGITTAGHRYPHNPRDSRGRTAAPRSPRGSSAQHGLKGWG